MKKRKRVIAAVIAGVMLITAFGTYAALDSDEVNINKELLESIRNDRPWVIETLVEGKYEDNPLYNLDFETDNNQNYDGFLKTEILERYETYPSLKIVVDAMFYEGNIDNFLGEIGREGMIAVAKAYGHFFGDNDEDVTDDILNSAKNSVKKTVATVDELQYEAILNSIILGDYTASWGESLQETDAEFETLRERARMVGKIKRYHSLFSTYFGYSEKNVIKKKYTEKDLKDNEIDVEVDFQDYVDNFLGAYETDLQGYFNGLIDSVSSSKEQAFFGKMSAMSAMAMLYAYEYTQPVVPATFDKSEIFQKGLCDKAWAEIGSALKLGDYALNRAMLLESFIAQKDSLVDTFERIENKTDNEDMKNVLSRYCDMIDEQGKAQITAYDEVLALLRSNTVAGGIIKKTAKKGVSKFVKNCTKNYMYSHFNSNVAYIAKKLTKVVATLELGVWLTDKIVGIEETAKQIYVIKYSNKVLKELIKTYRADLEAYDANKTDENAKKVLDDLELIKKIRLHQEKSAYSAMKDQLEKPLGAVLAFDRNIDEVNAWYQESVDMLMACTMSPIGSVGIDLGSNETITFKETTYEINKGENKTETRQLFYAEIEKSDGSKVLIPEADMKLQNGIDLREDSSIVYDINGKGYFPYVTSDTYGMMYINSGEVYLGGIQNNVSLGIVKKEGAKGFYVNECVSNDGQLILTQEGSAEGIFDIYMLDNTDEVILNNAELRIKGGVTNDGQVNGGKAVICGDGTQVVSNSYYEYDKQFITGNGSWEQIYFDNKTREGVRVTGTQKITGKISNPDTTVTGSQNLHVMNGCQIDGNYINSGLSFNNAAISSPLTMNGSANIVGDVAFNNAVTIKDGLKLGNESKSLTLNGLTKVKGDVYYQYGTITGSEWLRLYGDMDIKTTSPNISKLYFAGLTSQTVKSVNPLEVSELNNRNMSLSGVNFENKVYVTGLLHSDNISRYSNSKNLVLKDNAKLSGTVINGDISAENWTCPISTEINGTLYSSGTISLADNISMDVEEYKQKTGSMAIGSGSALNIAGDYYNLAAVTSEGTINVSGDTVTGVLDGGALTSCGDISGKGNIDLDKLNIEGATKQMFVNSGETNVKELTIKNDSETGVEIGSVIKVSEKFNNYCKNIINGKNIQLTGNAKMETDTGKTGDMSVSGTYIIEEDDELVLNGSLYMERGSTLELKEGSSLIINNNVDLTGVTINIAEGASMEIKEDARIKPVELSIDGDFIVQGDAIISGGSVSGSGTLIFKGDLETTSLWNSPDVNFISKVPQYISGELTVGDLVINNSSKTGITFDSSVKYTETISQNDSVINGLQNISKQ